MSSDHMNERFENRDPADGAGRSANPRRIGCALAAALATALAACASPGPAPGSAELAQYLSGHFTSAAQAATTAGYLAIELRVQPIWPERSDGPWLYVEQADARTPERPYRQRVYRLERQGEHYLSHIYTLKGEALRHAGAWRETRPLAALGPADLELRAGCEVVLTRSSEGRYRGATAERSCPSDLRGARWASSEVTLDGKVLESWDRGFDAAGAQVWGATAGPYRFVRIEAAPSR
jgi:hypothetical protein